MKCADKKTLLFGVCKGFCILFLGYVVVIGLLILFLTAVLSMGTYLPALTSFATEGRTIITGSFIAIQQYPLVFLLLLLLGGFVLQRFGWDEWF